MGKLCSCCACCKGKKKNKKNRNPSVAKVPSTTSTAFFIPPADVDKVISLEDLPMSFDVIEEHYTNIENVYAYAKETVKNFLGKPCYPFNTQKNQLYLYISHLCEGLQTHEYKEISAEKQQLSNIQVTVKLKDANLIFPKINGFSYIFCKLWINDQVQHVTTVKEATAYILWDEVFVLDVEAYESDVIHVEVWSSQSRLLEKVTALAPQSFKDDDALADNKGLYFIGDAVEYVNSLPCVGQNILWTLKKGPRRAYTKGQISLYLQLDTKKTPDFMLHLYCHITFIKLCYEKKALQEIESQSVWRNWLEILPNAALTLIQQHAIQHGISSAEQCLCSWLVAVSLKLKHEDRISYSLLNDLMKYLFINSAEIEVDQAKNLFIKSLSDFSQFSLDVLRNLHANFDLEDVGLANELFYLLSCKNVAELSSDYMDSIDVLQTECSEWYEQVIKDQKDNLKDDESVLNLCEALKSIMKIYLRNQIVLDNIFMRAWQMHYTSITYKELDKVVCKTIQPMIMHVSVLMDDPGRKRKRAESLIMLQLYHNVRNLVNYVLNIISTQSTVLRMDEYSSWFGEDLIIEWFLLCDRYTNQFIQKAVLADTMEKLSPEILYGTSIPDMVNIIDEMVIDVWMKLKWEDQFHTHGALIEAIKSCIMYYNKSMLERLEMEKFCCHFDDFDMTEKLCVAMSNIYALSEHLIKTSRKIKKELEVSESALGFRLPQPLLTIQNEMQIMSSTIFLLIFRKVSKRIKAFIKRSLNEGSESVHAGHLCLYMDTTFEVMYSNLKDEAFYISLRHIWIILVNRLKQGLNYTKRCFMTKRRKMHICMVILQLLNQMEVIFSCNNHGLTQYEMDSKMYKELKRSIENKLAVR